MHGKSLFDYPDPPRARRAVRSPSRVHRLSSGTTAIWSATATTSTKAGSSRSTASRNPGRAGRCIRRRRGRLLHPGTYDAAPGAARRPQGIARTRAGRLCDQSTRSLAHGRHRRTSRRSVHHRGKGDREPSAIEWLCAGLDQSFRCVNIPFNDSGVALYSWGGARWNRMHVFIAVGRPKNWRPPTAR